MRLRLEFKSAEAFASCWNVSKVFTSLELMLRSQQLDSVHVLVPPEYHYSLAKTALEFGVNVFLEKPMCTSTQHADELIKLAQDSGLYLGVNHNFLFSRAYQRLRRAIHSGCLGPLEQVTINHFTELGIRYFGPFESWMLREPGNLILETGPHLVSALLYLVGNPSQIFAAADRRVDIPGGAHVFSRWRVRAIVGRTAVDLNIDQGSGFNQRGIHVRGLIGSATADLDGNTCVVDRGTPLSIDLDRYRRTVWLAGQLRSQARETLSDYALSKLGFRGKGNPYEFTFLDSVATFYDALRSGSEIDGRIDSKLGRDVIQCCNQIVLSAGIKQEILSAPRPRQTHTNHPRVLIFGGTGFIGRELVRQLLGAGYCVRAAVRGSGAVLEALDNGNLDIVRADIASEANLRSAMEGIKYVYHLARTNAKSWEEYVKHDVESNAVDCCCLPVVKGKAVNLYWND